MPDTSTQPLIRSSPASRPTSPSPPIPYSSAYTDMPAGGDRAPGRRPRSRGGTALLVASGAIDWAILVGTAIGGYYLGDIKPNMRPFQLENADISFPHTLEETVPSRDLIIASILVPAVVIIIVSLTIVPGLGVPPGTPKSLIWRRKFWELYASLLSFALGAASQWFFVSALKNICGKPRPDMLARCQPDLANVAQYVVGGIANITSNGQLVSADICTNTDTSVLWDGFRSYPSGHSATSAAGLGHLALFLAYKFGVVYPFTRRAGHPASEAAFPSRLPASEAPDETYELADFPGSSHGSAAPGQLPSGPREPGKHFAASHPRAVVSARLGGAAPPLYLFLIVLVPFCGSVFIAASRWFNFRHHGFDILFGYFIGTVTGIISFRMYHMPMSEGAGWAWGPRSPDKAFWSGVGSSSWSVPRQHYLAREADEENGFRS